MPSRKRDPPCCRCNGSHARCKSCSCARAGKPCKDCHPVRHGSCRNNNNAPPTTGSDLSSGGLTVTASYIATTQSTQPTCSAVKHPHEVVDQPNCAAATHSFSNTEPSISSSWPTEAVVPAFSCASCCERVPSNHIRKHMQDHAFGYRSGKVPQQWLAENRLCICPSCNKLVAISWFSHHKQSCVTSVSHEVASSSTQSQSSFNLLSIQQATYPSIEEVLSCRCPTLKYIPKRARQHFGSVLVEVLKQVIFENSVEAWTRLLMLPKCVLPSSKRKGKGKRMIPFESLCQDWKDGKELLLWAKAVSRVSVKDYLCSGSDTDKKKLASAIACAEEGLFSKACCILTSHGIAPNNDTMLILYYV